jgi:hypothetical protein
MRTEKFETAMDHMVRKTKKISQNATISLSGSMVGFVKD